MQACLRRELKPLSANLDYNLFLRFILLPAAKRCSAGVPIRVYRRCSTLALQDWSSMGPASVHCFTKLAGTLGDHIQLAFTDRLQIDEFAA